MARARISKRTVDSLKPTEKDSYLWDTELAGFGVKLTPKGLAVYLVQYRLGGRRGRTRRVTLGRHGAITPDQARIAARRVLGRVANGDDPAEDKRQARNDTTIAELCDNYLEFGARGKRASTLATDRSNIERHIKPLLGRRLLSSVRRADIEQFQHDVALGKTSQDLKTRKRGRAIVTGGRGTAARSVAVLSAIFSYAVAEGMLSDNPAQGVKLYISAKRERYLSLPELSTLGQALINAEEQGANPQAITIIRLLILTGARKSEIERLTWSEVDLDRSCLRLRESKTGAKIIPLGEAAVEILKNLPRVGNQSYVFVGSTGGSYTGTPRIWRKVRSDANLSDVRLHDLRHSFASVAVGQGHSLLMVGKVLGHKQARTTEVYAHLADDPVRSVADQTAREIAAAIGTAQSG